MWELFCYAFVFLAEGVTAWSYFEHVFERKSKFRTIMWMYSIGYLLLFSVSQIKNVILNGSIYFIVNGIILFSNYTCKKIAGILQLCYLTFVMGGSEVIVALLLSFFSKDFAAYSYDLSIMVAFSVCSRLLFFFTMQISARCIRPIQDANQDRGAVLVLSVLPLASVWIICTIISFGMKYNVDAVVGTLMTGSVLLLLLVNLLVTVVYNYIQKINSDRLSMELQIQKEKADNEYYNMLQTQYESQRLLIHDIRGHLQVMYSLVVGEKYQDLQEYITHIEKAPGYKRKSIFCDNPILNSIITRYVDYCDRQGMEFIYDIRNVRALQFRSDEITTIFENLLSNAVEAAEKTIQKKIELSITSDDDALIIVVKNSCASKPKQNARGEYITEKKNKNHHGIGLKSLSRVIEKYHGMRESYYSAHECCFHTIIRIAQNESSIK